MRNEGKVFFYSIDKHFVNAVIVLFKKFITKYRKVFTLKSIKCLFNRFFCALDMDNNSVVKVH